MDNLRAAVEKVMAPYFDMLDALNPVSGMKTNRPVHVEKITEALEAALAEDGGGAQVRATRVTPEMVDQANKYIMRTGQQPWPQIMANELNAALAASEKPPQAPPPTPIRSISVEFSTGPGFTISGDEAQDRMRRAVDILNDKEN